MRPVLSSIDHLVSCIRVIPRKVPDQGIFASDDDSPRIEYLLAAFPQDLQMTNNLTKWYSALSISADSALKVSSGVAPATIDIESPYGVGGITRQLLEMNYLRGATCYVFNTCWTSPVEDEQPSGVFIWGKTKLLDDGFSVELTHVADLLKQDTHLRYSKLCSNFFCDIGDDGEEKLHMVGRCGLNPATYTVTGTLTAVTSDTVVADTSGPEADGYFDNGLLSFRNDTATHGIDQCSYEILTYVGGVFTLAEPIRSYTLLSVGTEYVALAGCKKRRDEDCVTRFSNGQRFMGFNDIPVPSDVYKLGGFK